MSDTEETPRRLPRWDGGRGSEQGPADDAAPAGVPEGGFDLGGLAAGEADTSLSAEELALPRGALVAFRKSGGLRFSSRSCVVYRSGRVERASLEGPARPTYLSRHEIARLRHLLLRARLASWERLRPAPSPDGYSYEIVARFGTNVRRVELADGHIPHAIEPLVRSLSRLLP